MHRRDFIKVVAGSAITWPLAARAQRTSKLPTIGILGVDSSVWGPWTAAFIGRLRELNWVEGRTITFEYRRDEGRPERLKENAAELVRQNVDVIVTYGSAVPVLRQAITNIPIVFAISFDPVRDALVQSLARPGGNATGLSIQSTDLVGKRLELLRGVIPQLRRLAIMADIGNPASVLEMGEVQAAARTLGLEVTTSEIRRTEDIAPAIETLKSQTDALYVVSDALVAANRTRIITFALSARLPTIFGYRDYVKAGGLMSYGADFTDLFRRAADIVDKILHGTKPGDIPIEQPTKFEFVLNLTTAKALGLTIPASFLSLADDLIE
ncbi:MAG: ABC transporter substrate-binding protein [Xanthobacteraceae bacterium]